MKSAGFLIVTTVFFALAEILAVAYAGEIFGTLGNGLEVLGNGLEALGDGLSILGEKYSSFISSL